MGCLSQNRRGLVGLFGLALVAAVLNLLANPLLPPLKTTDLPQGMVDHSALAGLEDEILWVDARDREDFLKAHVPGAVWLPIKAFDDRFHEFLDQWIPGNPVVVYCNDLACGVSESVAERLRETLGVGDVYVFHGGWMAWKEALE